MFTAWDIICVHEHPVGAGKRSILLLSDEVVSRCQLDPID